jgi:hypothetical protein
MTIFLFLCILLQVLNEASSSMRGGLTATVVSDSYSTPTLLVWSGNLLLVVASTVIPGFESCVTHNHIFLSHD